MGYTHFGKQAEVWKHLPLCNIIINEKPQIYVETNSAYADYLLLKTPEQEYGIFHFIKNVAGRKELEYSTYYQLEGPAVEKNCYLGSPALAMSILQRKIEKYVFFDLDSEALKNILRFSKINSLSDKIELINEDSRIGLKSLLDKLSQSAFIHIDPYDITEPASNGYSYLDLFIEASALGVKCLLWYGFNTLNEKERLNKIIKEKLHIATKRNFLGKELIMDIIEKDTIPCNPGILGSGLLAVNLSDSSFSAIENYCQLLVELWRDTKYMHFKGDLYQETIIR